MYGVRQEPRYTHTRHLHRPRNDGYERHPPDFRLMIKDSAKRTFNIVLVYKFDRFSRNKYDTAMHKKTLKDNGVKVVSATEFVPDTPEGIIFESMLEGSSIP